MSITTPHVPQTSRNLDRAQEEKIELGSADATPAFQEESDLRRFKLREDYLRLGHGEWKKARELFCCNYADAIEVIERTSHPPLEPRYEWHDVKSGYNYRI